MKMFKKIVSVAMCIVMILGMANVSFAESAEFQKKQQEIEILKIVNKTLYENVKNSRTASGSNMGETCEVDEVVDFFIENADRSTIFKFIENYKAWGYDYKKMYDDMYSIYMDYIDTIEFLESTSDLKYNKNEILDNTINEFEEWAEEDVIEKLTEEAENDEYIDLTNDNSIALPHDWETERRYEENEAEYCYVKPKLPESSRSSYEKDGIGYETKSKEGFKKASSIVKVGDCNIKAKQNRAGYIFYSVYGEYYGQDIGIAYFDRKWKAFMSDGERWEAEDIPIKKGDLLKFDLGITGRGNLSFKISNVKTKEIVFKKVYIAKVKYSLEGVAFNKQVTLVDQIERKKNLGIYLKNAGFSKAFLYRENGGKEKFDESNVIESRAGRFGCEWASSSKVSINDYRKWYAENVSLKL